MTERAIPRRAIFGWDPDAEQWVKIQADANGKLQITSTTLDTVLGEIQNETYGLEALKAAIDAIEGGTGATAQEVWEYSTRKLSNLDDARAVLIDSIPDLALEATLTAIKGEGWTDENIKEIVDYLGNATYGLSALKTLIDMIKEKTDNLPIDPADQSAVESVILTAHSTTNTKIDGVETKVDLVESKTTDILADTSELQVDWFDGGRLDLLIDAIKVKTDNLPSDPADESAIEAAITAAHSATETKVERKVTHMDFWADNKAQVVLTTVATADYPLNSLVIAGIPNGATLVRVVALLKIASIRDTSGSDNAVNGATALKVDADVAYGSTVTAIDIEDNSWAVDVSQAVERGGDVLIGDNDVKAEINGNGTFYAQLENVACDGNNLKLEDVAWGVRIYFY